jgi:hypothetical protein
MRGSGWERRLPSFTARADHCVTISLVIHWQAVLDGSVKFIKTSISTQTWWALATH